MNHTTELSPLTDWLIRVVKGALIGIGGILPGLSGGVLAVIFGIYDKVLAFFSHITKDFWKNMQYFIPVGIGFIIGIVIFSFFVEKAFGAYEGLFTCLFIGFVVGTFPSLFREAGKKGRDNMDWLIMGITAVALFVLMVMGDNFLSDVAPSLFSWVLSGALVGLGVIVPGMSPSNFLIYLGLYEPMSAGIASFDVGVIIPLGLGGVLCVLLLAKVASWLFDHFYSRMYHFILGTVVGSSVAIFPTVVMPAFSGEQLQLMNLSLMPAVLIALVMFIGGILFSLWFAGIESKYSRD
ncbi:MAG: DUF368 domain-containing protein [Aerococcus sp.]|nr:DUF368 domain-containing protein [Aerococcus sp.]